MVSDYVRRYYLENFKSRDTLFGCRQSWWCKQCSVAFTARVEELPCLQYNRVSLLLQKFLASVDSYANSKFFYTVFCKRMRNTESSFRDRPIAECQMTAKFIRFCSFVSFVQPGQPGKISSTLLLRVLFSYFRGQKKITFCTFLM